MVSAFEQSLANMTARLSQLTLTAEEKVSHTARAALLSFLSPFDICRNLIKFPFRTENFRSFAKLSRICGDKEPKCILVRNSDIGTSSIKSY